MLNYNITLDTIHAQCMGMGKDCQLGRGNCQPGLMEYGIFQASLLHGETLGVIFGLWAQAKVRLTVGEQIIYPLQYLRPTMKVPNFGF